MTGVQTCALPIYLDALRKEIQEFYKSHTEAAKLADKLGADRVGLEAFSDR